jgi:uncharacterized Zn ribbon protein
MEKCPQCNTDRPQDEQGQYLAFCDECGHKFSASSKPQSQPQTQPDEPGWRGNESKAFEEYEKDYVARVVSDETDTDESDVSKSPEIQGGAIWMPDGQPIYFEDDPKVVGRPDVSDCLKSMGKDSLQVSRKQFTIFKESDSYYIEDGSTSVQDKASGNHTTINGKDITGQGKCELNDGDTIGIATVLDVTFRIS